MKKITKLAVIGCGFFARNHLHAWRDLQDQSVHIAAVCDVDPEKAKLAAETFGVPRWYDDAAKMLDAEEPDLVDIVTQVRSHKALVEMTLGRGIASIVQKPFGDNLQECRGMASLAEETGIFLAVHENFRFEYPIRIVGETIRAGAIGKPNWGRISFRTGYDIFAGQPYLLEEERFVITDLGVHVLDLARFFFGEVESVSAQLQKRNPKVKGEDTATMMLRHVSGAVSVVECTYESRRIPDVFPVTTIEIEGNDGAIVVDRDLSIEVTSKGNLTVQNGDAPVLAWAERPWHVVQESVLRTCEHIVDRFRSGKSADVSAADNLRTYALCEAAYEASSRNTSVRPADLLAK